MVSIEKDIENLGIKIIDKNRFILYLKSNATYLIDSIENYELYIIKKFYSKELILSLRYEILNLSQTMAKGIYSCVDGCPDYWRIHTSNPTANIDKLVKAYYFHNWNNNWYLFSALKELFEIKNILSKNVGENQSPTNSFQDIISRIVVFQYPRGGGYLEEHTDPLTAFSKVQISVVASEYGEDYQLGGFYARHPSQDKKTYLDRHANTGDIIIFSPHLPHGVEEIDRGSFLDLNTSKGRWSFVPLIVKSDYAADRERPQKTNKICKQGE